MSRELRRFLLIWIVSSVVVTPFVAIFLSRHFWPGTQADASAGQVTDFTVGFTVGTPIFLLVLTFLAYVLVRFRQRGEGVEDGPRVHGHGGLAVTWILFSVAIAVGAVSFDVVRIVKPGAAGSAQGPSPLSPLRPASSAAALPVQVIGQQWQFSYRYPTYGGLETPHLVLPVGRVVQLHVTSLDVVHSFWAYELGVKADANPGIDNVAYVTPRAVGSFSIRCAELCGIWHGYMFDKCRVVSPTAFSSWIRTQQRTFAPSKRYLPPYRRTYAPDPQRRAG